MIMEAKKSQDLKLAGWRPQRTGGVSGCQFYIAIYIALDPSV
jgi:hypothetical protein